MNLTKTAFLVIVLVVLGATSKADALVLINGTGPWGAYTGSLDYSNVTSTSATLTVGLKNTSPAANGGYITAFAFNNPVNKITNAVLSATDTDFGILGGPTFQGAVNGAPYGQFDIGVSTGGSFEGGGAPSAGIAVNGQETFTLSLTGTGLDTINELNFLSELSTGTGAGEGYKAFVVRFRGFENGQSDKVPFNERNIVAPEPTSLLLLGSGILGGFLKRRRIKA